MKSPNALLGTLLGAILLAGCGQTGPLYMPKPPTKPAPAAQSPAATPAPQAAAATPPTK